MFVAVGDSLTLHFEVCIEPRYHEVEITDEDKANIQDYIRRYFAFKCNEEK